MSMVVLTLKQRMGTEPSLCVLLSLLLLFLKMQMQTLTLSVNGALHVPSMSPFCIVEMGSM